MIYLDWAATARPDEEAMADYLRIASEAFANPSSVHPPGREAHRQLELARTMLAGALGCKPEEIVFTSGGSESNWIVLSTLVSRATVATTRRPRVVASGIEHASVHDNLLGLKDLGVDVRLVSVGDDGRLSAGRILDAVDPQTVMVLLMSVNNVTGAIEPVAEVAHAVAAATRDRGRRIHVHTDAVQALGKVPLDLAASGVDTASFSAHKIGGPRGIGALYVRTGTPFAPMARGEQERGLRPGTENTAGAAAFARVAAGRVRSLAADLARVRALEQSLLAGLACVEGCQIVPDGRTAAPDAYTPYIVSVALPPVPSEVLVRALGAEDICVSSGSACASRSQEKRERVFRSMGVAAEIARSAIRVSLGPTTTQAEVRTLVETLARLAPRLSGVARGRAPA